jgi:hypothetical protein
MWSFRAQSRNDDEKPQGTATTAGVLGLQRQDPPFRKGGAPEKPTADPSDRHSFEFSEGFLACLGRGRGRRDCARGRLGNDNEKLQGPANSFLVACAFAPVAGALGYKIGRAEARRYRKTNGGIARTRKKNRTLENEGCGTRAARTHPSDASQAQGKRAGRPQNLRGARRFSGRGRWCSWWWSWSARPGNPSARRRA